jgi:ribonuclease-3
MSEGNGANGAGSAEPPSDPVAALEARLGFVLPDRRVALAALTHKSYVNEHREESGLADNERLEFLGDAVIDLAVSHRLMQKFPGAREGELSKMRAAVVDEQGLAQMARALELGVLLRLGRGEELTGGRRKASLLADAMEAVVAAIFVGGGLEPVLALVDRFLGDAFARASAGTLDRDYKTQLQELAQSRLRATPRYRVVRELGPDHSKTFEVETDLRGEVVGRGAGRSKKDAEQAAARGALDVLGRRFAEAAPAESATGAPPAAVPGLSPALEPSPVACPPAASIAPPADLPDVVPVSATTPPSPSPAPSPVAALPDQTEASPAAAAAAQATEPTGAPPPASPAKAPRRRAPTRRPPPARGTRPVKAAAPKGGGAAKKGSRSKGRATRPARKGGRAKK